MKPKPTLDAQDVSILKLHSVLSAMTKTGREQKVLRVKKKGGWEMSARASAGERLKEKKKGARKYENAEEGKSREDER